jgi:hypothetical protein
MATRTALDLRTAADHHAHIWAPLASAYPADALIALCSAATGFSARGHRVPLADVERFTAEVAHLGGENVYVGICPTPGSERDAPGRGRKQSALGYPALVADVDVAAPGHAAQNLPTREEADELIAALLGDRPRMRVETGGGCHIWLPLAEPLASDDPRQLAQRWKAAWVAAFQVAGRHLDAGVLADPARVLRVAGTTRRKPGCDSLPVEIVAAPGGRISLDELDAWLPPLQPRPARQATRRLPERRVAHADNDRPGDRLAAAVPVSVLLERVLGWERVGGADGQSHWAEPAEPHGSAVQAATYEDPDGIERLTVFSASACERLGLEPSSSLDSFAFVAAAYCGGDYRLAAQVARFAPDEDTLVRLLADHADCSPADLRAVLAVPDRLPPIVLAEAESPVADAALGEALGAPDGTAIALPGDCIAVVGSARHGLWHRSWSRGLDGKSIPTDDLVADWIAWRPEHRTTAGVDEQGRPQIGIDEYAVELIRRDGRRYWRDGLSAADSVSPARVVDALNAGVALPVMPQDAQRVGNMLRVLGHAEQAVTTRAALNGWLWQDDHATWAAPGGSINARGVDHDTAVAPPVGSDDDALAGVAAATGMPPALAPLDEAVLAIPAWLGIAPDRPEVGLALLGAVFAAPLRLATRPSIGLIGEPDSGKSLLLAATAAWTAAVAVQKGVATLSIQSSSTIGALVLAGWHRDGVVYADDYRLTDHDGRANETTTEVLSGLLQAAYGGTTGAKGTRRGGLRSGREPRTTVVWTGEITPSDAAVLQRTVLIEIGPGDLRLASDNPPIDAWRARWAVPGLARSLIGHYLAWLAAQADAGGGLDAISAIGDGLWRPAYAALGHGRSGETVAAISAGIGALRRCLAEMGVGEDVLPPSARVRELCAALARSQAAAHQDADPGRRVLAAVRDMLAGKQGHLLGADGRCPLAGEEQSARESRPLRLGWRLSESDGPSGTTYRWDACGRHLGWLSRDGRHVLLTPTGVRAARETAGMRGLADRQVARSLAALVVPGTTPTGRAPAALGVRDARRCWVFPASAFDLDDIEVEPEQLDRREF